MESVRRELPCGRVPARPAWKVTFLREGGWKQSVRVPPLSPSPCPSSQPQSAPALPRSLINISSPVLKAYPGLCWAVASKGFTRWGHSSAFLPWGRYPQSFYCGGVCPACALGPLIPLNTHCARKAEVPGNPDPQPPPAYPLRPVLSKDGFRETGAGPESYGGIWQLLAFAPAPVTLQYVS